MFGGAPGVRDMGLLESALGQPFATFDGIDLYPGVIGKASRLCYGMIADHPFVDGNKRTGAAVLGAYLRTNGVAFSPNHHDFLMTMLSVAEGALDYEGLVEWVRRQTGEPNQP